MNAVHLQRIDPARNMRRFYRLDVQPDLLGGFAVVKEWGRIGARGRMVNSAGGDGCFLGSGVCIAAVEMMLIYAGSTPGRKNLTARVIPASLRRT